MASHVAERLDIVIFKRGGGSASGAETQRISESDGVRWPRDVLIIN